MRHRRAAERCAPVGLVVLAASLAISCSHPIDPSEGQGFDRCNEIEVDRASVAKNTSLILIVNDTMRRDRTGAYGGEARTPHFDSFAASNLLFRNAISQSNWTRPAIATLFTSLYPTQHGVNDDPSFRAGNSDTIMAADVLAEDFLTLAEVMQRAGRRTAGFVSNPWMEEAFGFGQGFDTYDDSFARWGRSGDDVSRVGLTWLNSLDPDEPFFLYLHFIDSHLPYGTLSWKTLESAIDEIADDSRKLPKRDMRLLSKLRLEDGTPILETGVRANPALFELLYDRGLENFDRALGIFLEEFQQHPASGRSAIIITSDHGEALFERGYGNHGRALFQEEIAIPLAARFPGAESPSRAIDCPVGLIDIMPSICTYLDLACDLELSGESFLASSDADESKERDRYLVSEGVPRRPALRAIQNRRFKLIHEPSGRLGSDLKLHAASRPYSLYDLVEDPSEQNDLLGGFGASRFDAVFEVMKVALSQAVPTRQKPAAPAAPLDPELRERLRHLGYLDDGSREPTM